MIIKIFIILFILFVLSRIILRFKQGDITSRELVIWLVFWCLVAVVVITPKQTDVIAQFLGVGRGADLLFYLSILVLFFIVFKIIVKLEKIDRDITKVVCEIALEQENKKTQKQ